MKPMMNLYTKKFERFLYSKLVTKGFITIINLHLNWAAEYDLNKVLSALGLRTKWFSMYLKLSLNYYFNACLYR